MVSFYASFQLSNLKFDNPKSAQPPSNQRVHRPGEEFIAQQWLSRQKCGVWLLPSVQTKMATKCAQPCEKKGGQIQWMWVILPQFSTARQKS